MSQSDPAPDIEEFVKSLDIEQVRFFLTIFENGNGPLTELYMYLADRWNSLDPPAMRKVAHKTTERFFSEQARAEYEEHNTRVRIKQIEAEMRAKDTSNLTGGNGHSRKHAGRRIILPGEE
jgi:hypothetical protein